MSAIYLIRHAQAGTRDNYDHLSDLGREQVNRLQEYLAREEIKPAAVLSGKPRRQQETSMCVGGVTAIDRAWNEFQLSSLYQSFSERLSKDLDGFAADYEEMASALLLDPRTSRGAVGRCDQSVIRAWIENDIRTMTNRRGPDSRAVWLKVSTAFADSGREREFSCLLPRPR